MKKTVFILVVLFMMPAFGNKPCTITACDEIEQGTVGCSKCHQCAGHGGSPELHHTTDGGLLITCNYDIKNKPKGKAVKKPEKNIR